MIYLLSLGSNLGNREQVLHDALHRIEQRIGPILRCSSFFYSEPWGFESPHPFCNLCCAVQTDLEPLPLLRVTQAIERDMGRTSKTDPTHPRYTDRIIDIDIIRAFDDKQCEISIDYQPADSHLSLIIPHPLWRERDFVRVPLSEIGY